MRVHELLKRTGTRPGHIFNLGHGILPETPVENVKAACNCARIQALMFGNSGGAPTEAAVNAVCSWRTARPSAWRTSTSYLSLRARRPAHSARTLEEVRRRYAARSAALRPLLAAHPRAGRGSRSASWAMPVFSACATGSRSSRKRSRRMQADGVERLVALCLAPQFSEASVGLYFRRVQEAKTAVGLTAEIVWTQNLPRSTRC